MIKKMLLVFLCFTLFLSIPGCKKKLPTQPDIPVKILPTIEYFNANPDSIEFESDSIITLSWSVKNATNITIDQDVGTVSATDATQVSPEETTTYTLTATNSDGTRTASCTVEVTARAIFELTAYVYDYTEYGCCRIIGTVKNVGNAVGYNVGIEFQAYSVADIIIDTAHGFPADLGNIPVGVEALFEAIFFELYDWNVIAKITYEITWLTAQGMRLTQTGIVPFK
ncbi:hypothetical protein ES705_13256 [subsurface metagenome]